MKRSSVITGLHLIFPLSAKFGPYSVITQVVAYIDDSSVW